MSDCCTTRRDIWSGCGSVLMNRAVSKTIRKITVVAPELAERVQPGEFVMLRLLEGADPILGRPLAVFDADVETGEVDAVYAVVGKGTRRLAHLRIGDSVAIWGPLGNGWQAAKRAVPPKRLALVAGGVGHAPFHLLLKELMARPESERPETTLIYGARSLKFLSCLEDFRALGAKVRLATEDGSFGTKGFATDLLPEVLPDDFPAEDAQILACGPPPMLSVVAKWSAARNIECWTSLETPMACGLGLCYSCVVEWKRDDGTWDYKRACVDGPVFDASRLQWD
ncbi:MAG: dihydroorotate dehydrogenase electron transfer subunit [Thermoguttaceae bacterium]|jgi:dihydroorotate dehydrogenase electron transfer subunit